MAFPPPDQSQSPMPPGQPDYGHEQPYIPQPPPPPVLSGPPGGPPPGGPPPGPGGFPPQPPPPPKKKGRGVLIVLLSIVGVMILCCGGGAGYFFAVEKPKWDYWSAETCETVKVDHFPDYYGADLSPGGHRYNAEGNWDGWLFCGWEFSGEESANELVWVRSASYSDDKIISNYQRHRDSGIADNYEDPVDLDFGDEAVMWVPLEEELIFAPFRVVARDGNLTLTFDMYLNTAADSEQALEWAEEALSTLRSGYEENFG